MQIVGQNNGALRELLNERLSQLRNANRNNYLSARIKGGKDRIRVQTANKRGFTTVLDYSTNGAMGFMSPTRSGATANLVTTTMPALDRVTANYQYVQFGHEIDNENIANSNSPSSMASAKAEATMKEFERRLEVEEWFFCRGNGSQSIGDITAGSSGTTITCGGGRDGAGAWMIRVGQVIRIYDATLTTLKGTRTVTAKASNTSFTVNSAITVVDTDQILPESDATTPTTAGVKGLSYLFKTSGPYFDKSLATVPALQAIIDSATTSHSRTAHEILRRRHRSIRNNGSIKTMICASPAQLSAYYAAFYTLNSTQAVHVVGDKRPNVDFGPMDVNDYTWSGEPIHEFKLMHPSHWWHLDPSSVIRLTLKEAGEMLTPAGQNYVQHVTGGQYVNSQVKYSDDYLEYFSDNPARNAGFTAFGFSGQPLLRDDPFVG